MLHPSHESITSPIAAIELRSALSRRDLESPKESPATASQAREEEQASPICAAGWAY